MFASFIQKTANAKRKYQFCPFSQCTRALQKLSQHLKQIHPDIKGCVNEMYKLLKLAKSLPDVPSNFDDITTPTYLNYEGEEVSWESEDEEEVIYEAPPTKRDRD